MPFASLIVFFALYLGIVNNQAYSRYVRFNGQARAVRSLALALRLSSPRASLVRLQQAILLDIVLILPSLLENLFRMPSSGLGLNVYIALCALPVPLCTILLTCMSNIALPQTTRCGCTSCSLLSTPLGAAWSERRCCCRSWATAPTSR